MVKKTSSPSFILKIISKVKDDQEKGARKTVLEELFNDFHRDRHQVYLMNFIRGIMFGVGSVLGGTVLIALLIWILSLLAHFFPPLHDLFTAINHSIEAGKK